MTSSPLIERLEAHVVIKQGIPMMVDMHDGYGPREISTGDTVQHRNPDGPKAAALIRELVEALEKIAASDFNCSPHQYGMAAQGVAETALSRAKATSND